MDHRRDFTLLRDAIMSVHPNPFAQCSPAIFQCAVRNLWLRLPDMDREARIVAYAELLALIGDGHTTLSLPQVGVRVSPVQETTIRTKNDENALILGSFADTSRHTSSFFVRSCLLYSCSRSMCYAQKPLSLFPVPVILGPHAR